MSFKKIDMWTIICDGCGKTSGDNSEFAGWTEKFAAEDEATLFAGFIKEGDKHYCPDCTVYDEDKDDWAPKKPEADHA